MKLDFSGAPEITASPQTVWQKLLDPEFVAESAPGVESVERVDPTHFKVISGFGVGAVRVRFTLDVELFDIVEPERLTMRARGKAPGSAVDVVSALQVEDAGNGHARLNWSADQRRQRHRRERRRAAARGYRPPTDRAVLDRLRPARQRRLTPTMQTRRRPGPAPPRPSAYRSGACGIWPRGRAGPGDAIRAPGLRAGSPGAPTRPFTGRAGAIHSGFTVPS